MELKKQSSCIRLSFIEKLINNVFHSQNFFIFFFFISTRIFIRNLTLINVDTLLSYPSILFFQF